MRKACSLIPFALVASMVLAATSPLQLREAMSAAEFQRMGLDKLTPSELAALETWISAYTATAVAERTRTTKTTGGGTVETEPAGEFQVTVNEGDLVEMGPGVQAPTPIKRPMPRYPFAARQQNRSAIVYLRVLVDERGRVLEAERLGLPAGFGFDEAALAAAQRYHFKPATKNGVRVKFWTTIHISFEPPGSR